MLKYPVCVIFMNCVIVIPGGAQHTGLPKPSKNALPQAGTTIPTKMYYRNWPIFIPVSITFLGIIYINDQQIRVFLESCNIQFLWDFSAPKDNKYPCIKKIYGIKTIAINKNTEQ